MVIIATSVGHSLLSRRDGRSDVAVDDTRRLESVKAPAELTRDRVLQARLSQHT